MQVELSDDISIVKGCSPHNGSRKLHWVHVCHRSNGTSPANLISHLVQTRTCTFCLKLVGNGPPWRFCGKSQMTLLSQRIHFEHDTISGNWQILTFHIPIIDKLLNIRQRLAQLHPLRDFKSPFLGKKQIAVMRSVLRDFISKQII